MGILIHVLLLALLTINAIEIGRSLERLKLLQILENINEELEKGKTIDEIMNELEK